jgi:hypothetical protein
MQALQTAASVLRTGCAFGKTASADFASARKRHAGKFRPARRIGRGGVPFFETSVFIMQNAIIQRL